MDVPSPSVATTVNVCPGYSAPSKSVTKKWPPTPRTLAGMALNVIVSSETLVDSQTSVPAPTP